MKRRRTGWFAAALLGVVAVIWSLASSFSDTNAVQLRFLHCTNNTDSLDSDELAVFQKAEFLPPALPPATHAVLQLTNGAGTPLLLLAVSVSELNGGSSRDPGRTFDMMIAGNPGLNRHLASGEAVTLELKTAPTQGSWLADARFLRFGRARRWISRVQRYLPGDMQLWLRKRFLAIENTTVEFGAASASTPAPASP